MRLRLIPEDETRGLLLALLSAALLILAQPPFQFILLPFLALVPLGIALGLIGGEGRATGVAWARDLSGRWEVKVEVIPLWLRRPGDPLARKAGRIGTAFGSLYWGIVLLWVPLEVGRRFWWAFPGYLAQVTLLTGLTTLMAWGTWKLHRRVRLPLFLAFPLAWVGMEWVKAHFPLGLSFPWLGLGVTLTAWPELLGLAEWTGESGIAFWLALVNALVAVAFLRWRGRRQISGTVSGGSHRASLSGRARPLRPRLSPGALAGVAGACAVLPAAVGIARAGTLVMVPGPTVLVVGTGVPPELRGDPRAGSQEGLHQVEALLQPPPVDPADLVILPEALVGLPLTDSLGSPFRQRLAELALATKAPILFGALGPGKDGGASLPTNSVFLLDSKGRVAGRYDKIRLVPGMEQGSYQPGAPMPPLETGAMRLGPLVCYESIFGDLARRYGRAGGTLLVNLSSDVWFGTWGRWPGRGFLTQHPAHLVLRAVENRMGVARAANGGISLLLDPVGRTIVEPIPPGPGRAQASVPVVSGSTLFSRTGDLVGLISILFSTALILFSPVRWPWSSGGTESPDPPTG